MNLIDIVLLGIALGTDCFVVSFSQGLIFNSDRIRNSLKLGIVMGLFQGLMPVIGYYGTNSLYDLLVPYSKWIVFGIFLILGVKFILEAFQKEGERIHCLDWKCIIGFGIATSIDALVSGVSIRLTGTSLVLSGLVIGMVSFLMSLGGFLGSKVIKNIPPKYLEISGGVILIILALKSII